MLQNPKLTAFRVNKTFKDYAFLFIITLIVYWPLSLNYLSLKNDAVIYFLPNRYHISEAIQHGYFPFWTPYLYTGMPIHADMQSGVWNPFVLLLSLVSKYDMTLLQWEVLIYFFLSAIGMYRLIKYLGHSGATAICCAVSFMSCGYMTDSVSVILWVSGAAFIPFVILYLLRLLNKASFDGTIKFSFSLSLFFLCSYPSLFIFSNYLIGIGFVIWLIYQLKKSNKKSIFKTLLFLTVSYSLFLTLCSPAIISYYEFLPYYQRGSGVSLYNAQINPFHPLSTITYFLPTVTSKLNDLLTDVAMRNTYVGLFIFLFFLISLRRLNNLTFAVLLLTIFCFFISLGWYSPVHKIVYSIFPLFNFFRHPGTMRVFTSIGIIFIAAYPLNDFFSGFSKRSIQKLSVITAILLSIIAGYFLITDHKSVAIDLSPAPATVKQFIYSISFEKLSFFISTLQLIFLSIFLIFLRKNFARRSLIVVLLLNSIVFGWIALPGIVSQYKTSEVNDYLHSFPGGYPLPDVTTPIQQDRLNDSNALSRHGYAYFYNKSILIQNKTLNPTMTSDYEKFLKNTELRTKLKDYPFVYITGPDNIRQNTSIKFLSFDPNRFLFSVNAKSGQFHLFQQYNHNWHVTINNQPVKIQKSNIAFMSISIPQGTSLIEWTYRPTKVYVGIILSLSTLLLILIYYVFERKRSKHL